MTFSVAKRGPFRSLGRYRSNGKHAAPRGSAQPVPRPTGAAHKPAHAASMPRLTSPQGGEKKAA